MREKEVRDLYKAYRQVHQIDEVKSSPASSANYLRDKIPPGTKVKVKEQDPKPMEEEVDIYDIIRSHLLESGYAETPEAAFAIMANMSEEWRQSIVEAQEARNNPEKYEDEQRKKKSKKQRAMEDPRTGINSPAFAAFMKQQGR